MKKSDILILGAGCAGTSLAHYLEELGYSGKVVLLDSRTDFDREQRWCSWGKLPKSISSLVDKNWRKWTVCDENRTITKTSAEFIYQQIYAPQFFAHFHSHWQNSQTLIELRLGEKVGRITDKSDFVEVETDQEIWQANLVFDARHQESENFKNLKKRSGIYLHQTFLGWKIKFPRAVFDSETATLMDFRTFQKNEVNFIYVLPYSDREALIESTSFSQNPTIWKDHLQALTKYIEENFGDDYQVIAEESGELPMTTAILPNRNSDRIHKIGIAGGSARPSSGYAFHRIQRQTSEIAKAIIEKRKIPTNFAPRKFNFLDAVFLESIANNPHTAKDFFMRMFASSKSDALIRFLLDESSFKDDLVVIATLPKIQFGWATMQSLWRKFKTRDQINVELQAIRDTLCNSVD